MKSIIIKDEKSRDIAVSLAGRTPLTGEYEVVIRRAGKRNYEQIKRHWARMGWLSEHIYPDGKAYSKDSWHEYLKQELLGYVDLPEGRRMGVPMPEGRKELAQFEEDIDRWLAEELQVWIPDLVDMEA